MLFSLSGIYTPQAMSAMLDNPNSNRRAAIDTLLAAAGGKVVSFYRTMADGPGVLCIIDADPLVAPAVSAVAYASGAFKTFTMTRLFSDEETTQVRQKITAIRAAYKPPGQ